MFLSDVTALVPLLREGHFAFAVYTPDRTRRRWPLILAALAEQDVNDWVRADERVCVCGGGFPRLAPTLPATLRWFPLLTVLPRVPPQLSLLSDCCCQLRGIAGPPSSQALWSTTSKGDVMVHEPSAALESTARAHACDLM